jgi:hypothetical protein
MRAWGQAYRYRCRSKRREAVEDIENNTVIDETKTSFIIHKRARRKSAKIKMQHQPSLRKQRNASFELSTIAHHPPQHQNLMLRNKHTVSHRPTARYIVNRTLLSIYQIPHFRTLPRAIVICPENSLDANRVHVRNAAVARPRRTYGAQVDVVLGNSWKRSARRRIWINEFVME